MKKITFVIVLLLAVSTLAFSQQGQRKSAEERAEMFAKNLTKELALNEEQSSKVKAIQVVSMTKIDEIRAKGMESADKKAMRQEVKAVNETADTQITALLTADQKTKYEEWKVKRAEEMKNRGGGRGGNRK